MPKTAIAKSRPEDKPQGENQTIHRIYEGSFTTISNVVLHDDSLSFDAVGLLCRIMSLPQDWKLGTAHLRKKYGIGRDKLYRMIDELKAAGYVRYVQPRDDEGRMQKGVYYIAADPRSLAHLEPLPENPDAVKPLPENPDPAFAGSRKTRTHTKETEPTKETDSQSAQEREGDKSALKGKVDWWHRLHLYRLRATWPLTWGPFMGKPGSPVPQHLVELWRETKGEAFKNEGDNPATKKPAKKRWIPRGNGESVSQRPGTSHD